MRCFLGCLPGSGDKIGYCLSFRSETESKQKKSGAMRGYSGKRKRERSPLTKGNNTREQPALLQRTADNGPQCKTQATPQAFEGNGRELTPNKKFKKYIAKKF